MATEPSRSDEKPLPINCPKCGGCLHVHSSRTELDADGQPEPVQVYLCFVHGLFNFTKRRGLVDGP
jgi:hypothetical protein